MSLNPAILFAEEQQGTLILRVVPPFVDGPTASQLCALFEEAIASRSPSIKSVTLDLSVVCAMVSVGYEALLRVVRLCRVHDLALETLPLAPDFSMMLKRMGIDRLLAIRP
ncbi:MAG: STAS domain-containing protein [Planctomycetota bacterium]|nr:STAS domain-containing protein [Planctomycetota bacterium]